MAQFGRIDVVVNNAGYSLLGNFEEFTTEQIERQFAPNFWGVVYVMRAVLPVLRRQRSGHIINISSVAGVVGQAAVAAYGASKFAVEGLSLAIAKEVERFGIRITVVEPGFFRTGLLDPKSVEWSSEHIEDYGPAGNIAAAWSVYDGQQPNDPRHWVKCWSKSPAWSTRRHCSLREAMPSTRSPPSSRLASRNSERTRICPRRRAAHSLPRPERKGRPS